MIFGISAMIFGHDDIIPHIPLLVKHGIKFIEIRGYPPRVPYDFDYIRRLREELEHAEITVHSFHLAFNNLNISSLDEEKRNESIKEIIKTIELCEKLGCEIAVLHPGGKYEGLDNKNQAEDKAIESIGQILGECTKRGLKLAVENMLPGRVGEDSNFFKKLFDKIDSPDLGICFDSSHSNANGTTYKFLEKTKDKLLTVHFSDNHGIIDEHLFPFHGSIDWARIVTILEEINYKSVFLLEVTVEQGLSTEEHLIKFLDICNKLNQISELSE